MAKQYRVFAHNFGGDVTPQTEYMSYDHCEVWIACKRVNHFYFITSLDCEAANRRYGN